MTKDKALKLALEALEAHADIGIKSDKAITAIKEALANHFPDATKMVEQEPVAWLNRDSVDGLWHVSAFKTDNLEPSIPLYKHPAPQPEQEPVATWENHYGMKEWQVHALRAGWSITPPQRTWIGLTWEEIDECFKITPDQYLPAQIYRRIEAKLKERNT